MTHHRLLRPLALAIGATVTALVLSSCAPGGGAAPAASSSTTISAKVTPAQVAKLGSTTLSVWADQAEQPLMKNFIPAFEKKYPNVKVKFNYQGGDVGSLVMTQLQAGTAPDILTSFPGGDPTDNADTLAALAAHDRILPLTASWTGQIPKAWESSFNYKGKTYAYPHDHPDGVLPQQYPPDALVGRDYYHPTARGAEGPIAARLAKLRAIIRRSR